MISGSVLLVVTVQSPELVEGDTLASTSSANVGGVNGYLYFKEMADTMDVSAISFKRFGYLVVFVDRYLWLGWGS